MKVDVRPRRIYYQGSEFGREYAHKFFMITSSTGAQFALDLSYQQFGFLKALSPLEEYIQTNVKGISQVRYTSNYTESVDISKEEFDSYVGKTVAGLKVRAFMRAILALSAEDLESITVEELEGKIATQGTTC